MPDYIVTISREMEGYVTVTAKDEEAAEEKASEMTITQLEHAGIDWDSDDWHVESVEEA